jgi:hypothetical protein
MGRSLTFLARIIQDGWSKNPREIAVDEKRALCWWILTAMARLWDSVRALTSYKPQKLLKSAV